jgi:UPF0755 protein
MLKKILIFVFFFTILTIGLAFYKVYYSIETWRYQGLDQTFEIKRGENFSKINYNLGEKRLISSKKIFYRYAKINGLLTKFKAGNYNIKKNSNMIDVVNTLVYGNPISTKLTIPEGKNIFEVAKILQEKNICNYDEFIKLAKNKNFTKSLDINASRVEGYLYPDTYQLSSNTPADQVIRKMVSNLKQKILNLDFSKTNLSVHEVIILASIVEKETGAAWERPIIAGVFLNRLKKGMRLQTDPTIIYGIYEQFDGNIRLEDKKIKNPYNTYVVNGLPIGPISNPGFESIKAVLEPAKHNFLYFVSKNDGTHSFSPTYLDHIKKVEEFQKNHLNREGKSWRDLNKKDQKK